MRFVSDQAGRGVPGHLHGEEGQGVLCRCGRGQGDPGKVTLLQGDYVGSKALLVRKKAFVLRMLRGDFEELGLPKKLKLAESQDSLTRMSWSCARRPFPTIPTCGRCGK